MFCVMDDLYVCNTSEDPPSCFHTVHTQHSSSSNTTSNSCTRILSRFQQSTMWFPCECSSHIINEHCLWTTLDLWIPSRLPLVCGGYLYSAPDMIHHVYVSTTITNESTCTTLLDPTNTKALYTVHRHNHIDGGAYRTTFECGLWYLLNHEVTKVTGKLNSKDVAAVQAGNARAWKGVVHVQTYGQAIYPLHKYGMFVHVLLLSNPSEHGEH